MLKPSIQESSVSSVTTNIFSDVLDVSEIRSVAIQVSGTFVLSLIIEVSNDLTESTAQWNKVAVIPADGSAGLSEITESGMYILPLGYRLMRCQCTQRTSGTANVKAVFSQSDSLAQGAIQRDATERFRISDIDDAGSTQYYGYIDDSGRWYIMQFDTTTKQMRYTKGLSSYSTNWTNRASQSYGYFNAIF